MGPVERRRPEVQRGRGRAGRGRRGHLPVADRALPAAMVDRCGRRECGDHRDLRLAGAGRGRPALQQLQEAASGTGPFRRRRAGAARGHRRGTGVRGGRLAPDHRGQRLRDRHRPYQARGPLRHAAGEIHPGADASRGRPRARARQARRPAARHPVGRAGRPGRHVPGAAPDRALEPPHGSGAGHRRLAPGSGAGDRAGVVRRHGDLQSAVPAGGGFSRCVLARHRRASAPVHRPRAAARDHERLGPVATRLGAMGLRNPPHHDGADRDGARRRAARRRATSRGAGGSAGAGGAGPPKGTCATVW